MKIYMVSLLHRATIKKTLGRRRYRHYVISELRDVGRLTYLTGLYMTLHCRWCHPTARLSDWADMIVRVNAAWTEWHFVACQNQASSERRRLGRRRSRRVAEPWLRTGMWAWSLPVHATKQAGARFNEKRWITTIINGVVDNDFKANRMITAADFKIHKQNHRSSVLRFLLQDSNQ